MGIIYHKSIASELAIKELTVPSDQPVSLAEQKIFSRIDGSLEDSLITMMIKSATKQAERYINGGIITRKWQQSEDAGHYQNQNFEVSGIQSWFLESFGRSRAIEIKNIMVSSIESFKVYDNENVETTIDPLLYRLDRPNELQYGRLVFKSEALIFSNSRYFTQYKIAYTAGWENAAAVPDDIKIAIMNTAQASYENRETMDGEAPNINKMLSAYRVIEIA